MIFSFLIIGFGSIGRRHAINLQKLNPKKKIYLISETPINKFTEEKYIHERLSLSQLSKIKEKLVIFICNTPNLHLLTANKFINKNYSIFIEKPISIDLRGLSQFISKIQKKKIICQVGYQFRYHPLILKLKKIIYNNQYGKITSAQINCSSYLPNWRKGNNYKNEISAKNNLGGGVIRELSHEIDYAYFLFGKFNSLNSNISNTKTLQIETEDSVDLILNNKFISCNIHLNFHSHFNERYIKINFEKASIKLDILNNEMLIYSKKRTKKYSCNSQTYENLFILEIKDFIKKIKKNNSQNKILKDSHYIMKIISNCYKSHKSNKRVYM